MERLTKEQAAVITAYTGIMTGDFDTFHQYAEKIMGRPVFTHEFGNKKIAEEIKEASKEDFLFIQP